MSLGGGIDPKLAAALEEFDLESGPDEEDENNLESLSNISLPDISVNERGIMVISNLDIPDLNRRPSTEPVEKSDEDVALESEEEIIIDEPEELQVTERIDLIHSRDYPYRFRKPVNRKSILKILIPFPTFTGW